MAVGCAGDFEEDGVWGEGLWVGGGDWGDFVGLVELCVNFRYLGGRGDNGRDRGIYLDDLGRQHGLWDPVDGHVGLM